MSYALLAFFWLQPIIAEDRHCCRDIYTPIAELGPSFTVLPYQIRRPLTSRISFPRFITISYSIDPCGFRIAYTSQEPDRNHS